MIVVTESARDYISELLRYKHPDLAVRLSVSSGGCSGFSYFFSIAEAATEDQVVRWEGGCLVMDDVSADILEESTIDLVDDLRGQYLTVQIPHAESRCGCGTSFSL